MPRLIPGNLTEEEALKEEQTAKANQQGIPWDDPEAGQGDALNPQQNPIDEAEKLATQQPQQAPKPQAQNASFSKEEPSTDHQSAARQDMLNNLLKQGEIGRAGAAQFHDRKYDNPASQKVYDQLIEQRRARSEDIGKADESRRKNAREDARDPLELQKMKLSNDRQESDNRVATATETDRISQESSKTKEASLRNTDIQQKIDFAEQENPEKLRSLKARTHAELATVRRLGKLDRTLTPSLAKEYAKNLGIPEDQAAALTYEDAELLMKSRGNKDVKLAESNQKQVESYSKRLEKAQVPTIKRNLDEIDSMLKDIGGDKADIPGFGATAALPDFAVSKMGKTLRQNVQSAANILYKSRSGSAVTAPEERRLLLELGTGNFKSDAQLREGLKLLRRLAEAEARNINAGFDPSIREQYRNNSGDDFEINNDKQDTPPPAISEKDKAALDWANSNPTDPRATEIKKRLGQ